jgi:hypothetical protein
MLVKILGCDLQYLHILVPYTVDSRYNGSLGWTCGIRYERSPYVSLSIPDLA